MNGVVRSSLYLLHKSNKILVKAVKITFATFEVIQVFSAASFKRWLSWHNSELCRNVAHSFLLPLVS